MGWGGRHTSRAVTKVGAAREEADLVRRAKAGDVDAFATIFDRHYGAVYRYISYRLGDTALAEDLTSDVFVRCVERIDWFRYRGRPILAWLYAIARNLVIDHFRRVERHPTAPLPEGTGDRIAGGSWEADWSLTTEMLVQCLSDLTEDQRRVILLKFVEGYPNADVARILGKTEGAVKSLQHRALAAMRRCVERGRDG